MSKRVRSYIGAMINEIAADRVLYGLLVAYCALALLYVVAIGSFSADRAAEALGVYTSISLTGYCIAFPMFLLIATLIQLILLVPHRRVTALRLFLTPRFVARFVAGTLLLLAMIPFRAVFNLVKVTIPEPGGFTYDEILANIDKMLHFGVDPFHFLHAFGRNEVLLRLVELNYNNFWFVITFGTLYWIVVSPRYAAIRLRFVACFVVSWALSGTLVAVLGSSAGPVYYGAVTGDTGRFADLVAFVHMTTGQPGSAADFQEYLWHTYASGELGLGSGISAFPSVHVTIITMLALFVSEQSRRLGIAAWAYVILTCMCSVYLGWHYAVDGYAAIALATATHFGIKKLAAIRWRRGDLAERASALA